MLLTADGHRIYDDEIIFRKGYAINRTTLIRYMLFLLFKPVLCEMLSIQSVRLVESLSAIMVVHQKLLMIHSFHVLIDSIDHLIVVLKRFDKILELVIESVPDPIRQN